MQRRFFQRNAKVEGLGKEIVLGEGMYLLDLVIVLLAGCKQIDGQDFLN
jgi:hypothetical protein